MEMLFSCPRCTGVPKSEFGSLAENGRFLNKPLIWKCYFHVPAALAPIWRPKINYLGALPKMVDFLISRSYGNAIFLSPLHWCPFGVPKSEFGSLAENGRFLNKPLIWKCCFLVLWKCYFPVPAALVPIWRPEIGIWEPCRKWSIS